MSGAIEDDFEAEEEILFVPKKPSAAAFPSGSAKPSTVAAERFEVQTLRDAIDEVAGAMPVQRVVAAPARRILVVLDLNGLLFFREKIEQTPRGVTSHAQVGTFNVWDRRHGDSFLDFVFSSFDVGVWSSARQENVTKLVERTFGPKRMKSLVFMWDQSYCTVEKRKPRPLFAKELRKVWEAFPQYDRSNTLLIDDDEEKAKHNPDYSAIHPKEWTRHLPQDDKLGPGGVIRRYLETMLDSLRSDGDMTVEEYVRTHPFEESD